MQHMDQTYISTWQNKHKLNLIQISEWKVIGHVVQAGVESKK